MADERDTIAHSEEKQGKKKYAQPSLNFYGNILEITTNVGTSSPKNDPGAGQLKTG
jgi:hypothetical protein